MMRSSAPQNNFVVPNGGSQQQQQQAFLSSYSTNFNRTNGSSGGGGADTALYGMSTAYNNTFTGGVGGTQYGNSYNGSSYYNASGRGETFLSKLKGDEGIYAAVDAVRLARALKGTTLSRLLHQSRLKIYNHQNNNTTLRNVEEGVISLGAPPASYERGGVFSGAAGATGMNVAQHAASGTATERQTRGVLASVFTDPQGARRNHLGNEGRAVLRDIANMGRHVPVGIPNDVFLRELRELLPYLRKLKPAAALDYEALLRLFYLCRLSGDLRHREQDGPDGDPEALRHRIISLDLSDAVVAPQAQPPLSQAALQRKMQELRERYPLPARPAPRGEAGEAGDEEEEEEEEQDPEQFKHNEALRAKCEKYGLPYTTYRAALESVARYETRVFYVLCRYLERDTQIQILSLRESMLGADSAARPPFSYERLDENGDPVGDGGGGGDANFGNGGDDDANDDGENNSNNNNGGGESGTVNLWPLRCLAAAIDANETLKVLDLSHNQLGPNGTAIIAKALTKNIALRVVDLSGNQFDAEPLEEVEDPEHGEDDPVFGETAENPLEALAEVLKKNKFLRVLRLAYNGIHAGDGAEAPEPEDVLAEFDPATDAMEIVPPPAVVEDGGAGEAAAAGGAAEERAGGEEEGEEEEDGEEGGTTRKRGQGEAPKQPYIYDPDRPDAVKEANISGWEGVPLWSFLAPLMSYHKLEVLDLSGNQLRAAGAKMLATALSTNTSVKVLDLTDNDIQYRGLHYLALLVLRSPVSALHTLNLRRNNLPGKAKTSKRHMRAALEAMTAFSQSLRGNRRLRSLTLASNHLGPRLAAALLADIGSAEALEELDLEHNEACGEHCTDDHFDPAAAERIAAGLLYRPRHHRAPTLAVLRLSGNSIGTRGAAVLFPPVPAMLAPPHALVELDLSRSHLGAALDHLATFLGTTQTLRRLNLSYNNISSTAALLPGLRACEALEDLDLSHNKIGMTEEFELRNTTTNQSRSAAIGLDGTANTTTTGGGDYYSPLASYSNSNSARQRERNSGTDFDMLLSTLAGAPCLRSLDLSWNDLRSEHAFVLLRYLTVKTPAGSKDTSTIEGEAEGEGDSGARRSKAAAEKPPMLFSELQHIDISNNAKLLVSNVQSCIEGIAGRPGLVTFYATAPNLVNINKPVGAVIPGAAAAAATADGAAADGTMTRSLGGNSTRYAGNPSSMFNQTHPSLVLSHQKSLSAAGSFNNTAGSGSGGVGARSAVTGNPHDNYYNSYSPTAAAMAAANNNTAPSHNNNNSGMYASTLLGHADSMTPAEREQMLYNNHMSLLQWIYQVVMRSDTLQDIDCGLKRFRFLHRENAVAAAASTAAAADANPATDTLGALEAEEADDSREGQMIGAIRRRLLLNALVAERRREGGAH